MYPVRILSLNNGWNLLREKKSKEWNDIEESLNKITEASLKKPSLILKDYDKPSISGMFKAQVLELIQAHLLKRLNWNPSKRDNDFMTFRSALKLTKNKVGVCVMSTEQSAESLEQIIYIDAPRSVILGRFDVWVVLVPVDNIITQSKGGKKSVSPFEMNISTPFNEKKCREKLKALQPIESSAPIVFVFCSLEKSTDIEVSDLLGNGKPSVDRAIEFPPEYYHAGLTVLANFGEVLRQKYPNINARVRIEQDGNVVRMHVELPNGEIDTVEEVLEKYFLVIQDKAPASSLFENKFQVMLLESRIDTIKSELRSTIRAYDLALSTIGEMRVSHEHAVENFQRIIGEQSTHISTLIQLSAKQTASHERIQIAQIGHTNNLFERLLSEANDSQAAVDAIRTLQHHLMANIAVIDAEDQIKAALTTIKQEKPNLLNHLAGQIESAGFGALGGVALDWIIKHTL